MAQAAIPHERAKFFAGIADFDNVLARVVPDQVLGPSLHEDPAVVHDDEPVAEPRGLLHVVRRKQDGDAPRPETLETLPELVARLGVEPRRGFVEDQQVGFVDQGPGEHQAPHQSPRELGDGRVLSVFQGDELQQRQGPFGSLRGGEVEVGREDLEVLEHREFGVEVVVLLADTDPVFDLAQRAPARDVLPENVQGAPREGGKSVDHPDRRGLAGAVGPEDAEALAPPRPEADPVDGREGAEGFLQVFSLDDVFHGGHYVRVGGKWKIIFPQVDPGRSAKRIGTASTAKPIRQVPMPMA